MSYAIQIQTVNVDGVTRYSFTPGNNPIANLRAQTSVWQLRHKSRRELRRVEDHILRDIGIDREAANREASKRFWQE